MRRVWIGCLFLSLLPTFGCAEQVTQLIVVVESDLAFPTEYNGVKITAVGPEGTSEFARDILPTDGPARPVTATVYPLLDSYEPLSLTVRAEGAGMTYPPREIETRWLAGQSRVLDVFLSRDCMGVTCADGQTCIDGACGSTALDPTTLPEWDGSDPAAR